MRFAARLPLIVLSICVLASCGGGGGGGGHSTPAATSTTTTTTTTTTTPTTTGYAAITVGPGVTQEFGNILTTTVTICLPKTTTCSTIPNVQVDTGSTGLRLLASAIDAGATVSGFSASLPVVEAGGAPEAECAQFADGIVWGAVRTATVTVGGATTTAATPIQVIADSSVGSPPASCASIGSSEDTAALLGANGIIGVGYFLQDCGNTCVQTDQYHFYYACSTSTSCTDTTVALNDQLLNTVASFPSGFNNGDIIELPGNIAEAGEPSVSGNMVFGVTTATLSGTPILSVDSSYGTFTVAFNGSSLTDSFIDSGSSVYFFSDSSIPVCTGNDAGYYCPTAPFNGSGVITGVGTYENSLNFNFLVVNPNDVSQTSFAFNDLAAPISSAAQSAVGNGFDIGLPYFFGHSVFTVFDGRPVTGAGYGPFAAIAS